MTLRGVLVLGSLLFLLGALVFAFGHSHHTTITKPSPYLLKPLDGIQVFRVPQKMTPEHKFCNPDYEFGPGEIPQISGRCLPVPISCDATRDFYTPQSDARCPGRI
jgi:hypothetical protein